MAKKKKKRTQYSAHPGRDTKLFGKRIKRIIAVPVIFVIVAAALVMVLMRSPNQMNIGENAVGSLLAPVQNAVRSATSGVINFFTNWRNYEKLQRENELLRRKNQQLSLELKDAEEILLENARLESLAGAKSAYAALEPIYADVIAREPGQWFSTFSINRGSMHGVSIGMAVVNGDGLIGRVYDVGLNYAKVLTIIDPRSGLACLVQRTRDNGIMRGTLTATDDEAECYVHYLPNVNNVMPGDVIITSGTDEVYPKGLTIGTVTQVSLNAGSEGNYAIVSPAVDFRHIEEVLILRNVVETDNLGQNLPSMLTPSPAPSPTPAPTPDPASTISPSVTEGTWEYPTANRGNRDVIESLPEDEWANN